MILVRITSTKEIIEELLILLAKDFPILRDYLIGMATSYSLSAEIVNATQQNPETIDIRFRAFDTFNVIENHLKKITKDPLHHDKTAILNYLDEEEYKVMLLKAIRTMSICNGSYEKNCYVYHAELLQESEGVNLWRHVTFDKKVQIEEILKSFDADQYIPNGKYKISMYTGKNGQDYIYSEIEYVKQFKE